MAQPANDECQHALPIAEGSTAFSTVDATNNGPLHPSCKFDPENFNDIWFEYVAGCTGNLTISTCDTADYDTDLTLYDGCDCDTLLADFEACNDDASGCSNFTSVLTGEVVESNCYLIRVGGYSQGSEGSGSIDIGCSEFGDATCCLPDETCAVISMESCANQGGEFHSTFTDCAVGVCSFGDGADVIYSGSDTISNWGSVGGIRGYSLQSQTCNIGDTDLQWSSVGPLLAMNAYRLNQGRLLQIGMSWVKNATTAFAGDGCAPPCMGGGGSVLGPGCKDVYSSGFNGGQGILGPRSDVNAFTGAYPGPSGGGGNAIYKRLQIAESELSPAAGLYFIEGHYVAPDDAASGNAMNNASYKRITVETDFDLTPQGAMFETVPGIFAWRDHGLGVDTPDPGVQVIAVDLPGEGRFQFAAKVSELGGGRWLYDYAVRNHNSHRGGGSFSVPLPAGATVSNVGFHDVDYHSGEPYANTDWTSAVLPGNVQWSSPETFAQNPETNALRFATMYNFWFETDVAPGIGIVTLGLFRPDPSGPDSISAGVPVPAASASTPAGAVPDSSNIPGTPLTLDRNGVDLDLVWGASCSAGDVDYAIYEGQLGSFGSHLERVCSTGGATFATIAPDTGSSYYLVVPLSPDREGSYGTDSGGAERGQGLSFCEAQQTQPCL